jgi:hypothetical protein
VRGVALGRRRESEHGVDVEDPAPLALEGADEQLGADAVTTDGLVRAAMQAPPAI